MDKLLVLANVLAFLLLAPFLEGVIRRVTARVQSRKGPPLVQPWLDLLKLLGKEDLSPAGIWPFPLPPAAALASILAAVAILPVAGRPTALSPAVDAISLVYLLTLGGVAVLLGALSSGNPFSGVGASREMITMIMVEPILVMILMLGVVSFGASLASGNAPAEALMPGLSGLGGGLVTAVLMVGLLPFFEFVFGVTTDITLLELGNPSHPLLKRLITEAPGTYSHSVMAANLAETAARHGAFVVSDEIHGPLTHDASRFTPFLSVSASLLSICPCQANWRLGNCLPTRTRLRYEFSGISCRNVVEHALR